MTTLNDRTIGVYELKAKLSSVLEEVLAGHIITVTRHGHPIASIQPVVQTTREQRLAAIERMRENRKGRTLGMSAKDAINEGRRFV